MSDVPCPTSGIEKVFQIETELLKISNGIETMGEKQDQIADDVKKIKEAVYNPEDGLYSRIKEIEVWKKNVQKMLWMVISTTVGLVVVTIWKLITKHP
jgi:hypothetical protein